MRLLLNSKLYTLLIISTLLTGYHSFSQCTVQTGPLPAGRTFNTGRDAAGNATVSSSPDVNWTVGQDSITALYNPAIVMKPLDQNYFSSNYPDCKWISFSDIGEHTSNRFFFFKRQLDLPCFDLCGKSVSAPNTFCLNLDLYTDNSVFEIFVNGIAQGIVPFADPYNPPHTQHDRTTVSLCKDWKPGNNTLIIQVASSATVVGLLAQNAVHPVPPAGIDTITANICEGEVYHLGSQDVIKSGYYFEQFARPGTCDSNVAVHLIVHPKPLTTVNQDICEGQSYEGHTTSGTFVDTFASAGGCDSIRTLNLTVHELPKPDLGTKKAICAGDSLLLSPGSFLSYEWQDGSTGNNYLVRAPGLYSVTVTNSCGTAHQELVVKPGICNIYFPNAFTPNNDGKNETFKILTDYFLQDYLLVVYNRWGQKVFETTNPLQGWDGTLGSKPLNEGGYVWMCHFMRQKVRTNMKGTVMLLR
jgi:gliding motility-associated-like protein